MFVGRSASILATLLVALASPALAQVTTYHLHNEASATASTKQLRSTGPDVAQVVLQTAALQGVATGEKLVAQFDTAAGVPNTAGKIPTGATVTATVWMRKTAALGTMFPRVKVRLNNSTGTSLCTATGTTALTTTLTAYTLTCTTTAHVTLTATSRYYVWAGVNLTAGSSAGAFRGELGLEGTLNGAANSRVDIPTALPAPTISSLTPNAGPVGTTVTITGNHFRDQPLGSVVTFSTNRTATVTSWSNTSIVTTVPASTITGAVRVTVAGTASTTATFTVGTAPVITQLSPAVGLSGTAVTITGTGFGATKGTSTVRFNGLTAATTSWSTTSIGATVPAGATTGPVTVTVGGLASAGVTFMVPTLTAVSVSPQNAVLPQGSHQRYSATATYSNGAVVSLTSGVTWSSTNTAVATIAATGITQTLAQGTAAIQATFGGLSGQATAEVIGPSFVPVGNLLTPRMFHAATLLPTGKVLLTGGDRFAVLGLLSSAELFNPMTRTFEAAAPLPAARSGHTATLLADGRVLIAGGNTVQFGDYVLPTNTAVLYDPIAGTVTATGSLQFARVRHTATVLPTGLVLVVGGGTEVIEVYDPATGTFTAASDTVPVQYEGLSATRLNDGNVLLAGGSCYFCAATSISSLYSAVNGGVTATGTLGTASRDHAASLLGTGAVVVAGGLTTEFGTALSRTEVYDPATGLFMTAPPLVFARGYHTATTLADGSVLVVGGGLDFGSEVAPAERFDPGSLSWFGAGAISAARSGHTATLLADGTVLVAGGFTGGTLHTYAELYGPPLPAPTSLQITPATLTLQKGQTQQYTVADELGRPRHDATWAVSDTTTATIGAFSSPTLTAVDYGQVTVTATVGNVSAQATVIVSPTSLQVTPAAATMLVGETRPFAVVDQDGRPTTRASWTLSAPSLASLAPGSQPRLTAVLPGSFTLTATVQGVSASADVTIAPGTQLPAGTERWITATPASATARRIVEGAPINSRGPSLFAVSSTSTGGLIQGLTTDGLQLWSTTIVGQIDSVTPNGLGGVFVVLNRGCSGSGPLRIVSLDGATGVWAWEAVAGTSCTSESPQFALRPDGFVAISTPGNLSGLPGLTLMSGATGAVVTTPPIPQSSFKSVSGQVTLGYSRVGPPIVDRVGRVHLLYERRVVDYPPQVTSTTMWLMTIRPNFTAVSTQLFSTNQNTNLFPGRIIPDGSDGVIATWIDAPISAAGQPPIQPTFRAARTQVGGAPTTFDLPIAAPLNLPLQPNSGLPVLPLLSLGEDDSVFVTYGNALTKFNVSTGAALWSYAAPAGTAVSVLATDSADGVVAKTSGSTEQILRFNAAGGYDLESWLPENIDYLSTGAWISSATTGSVASRAAVPVALSTSGWFSATMGQTNQASTKLFVFNPDNTPGTPRQTAIRSALTKVKLALEAEGPPIGGTTCGEKLTGLWPLGSLTTPLDVVNAMLDLNRIGSADFRGSPDVNGPPVNWTGAFRGAKNLGSDVEDVGVPAGWMVTVNVDGGFFNQWIYMAGAYFEASVGPFPGGTMFAQALILLHEAAHITGAILEDGAHPAQSVANTDIVYGACKTLVDGLQP